MRNVVDYAKYVLINILPFLSLTLILFLLFRNFFLHGFLVYPDYFETFQGIPSYFNFLQYLSSWSVAYMGSVNTSALPDYAILSLLSGIGIYGTLSEILVILAFLILGLVCIYLIMKMVTSNHWIQSLSMILYVITPMLFITMFNGDANFTFYALVPVFFLAGIYSIVFHKRVALLLMAVVIAFGVFWDPFMIIYILPISAILFILSVIYRPNLRYALISLLFTSVPFLLAVLLNIPYFYTWVSSASLTSTISTLPSSQNSYTLLTYQWATPIRTLTLLAGDLFPRYSMFYTTLKEELLLVLPIGAIAGYLNHSSSELHRLLKFGGAMLIAVPYALIELLHYGLLEVIFNRIPILYVYNFPDVLSYMLNFGYAILIPLSLISTSTPSTQVDKIKKKRLTLKLGKSLRRYLKMVSSLIIVSFLLFAASTYLASGDFNLSHQSENIGFPPQWTPNANNSFYEIYYYLEGIGALQGQRLLILPTPGMDGGQQFRGFYDNLFNPSSEELIQSNSTNLLSLGQSPSGYYSTMVLNDLVNDSTDMIGIPLGYASVEYIVVDKALNFTGPPRWVWGSIVGSPSFFMRVLSEQRDLKLILDNSEFAVFKNLDFKPIVQEYTKADVIAYNSGPAGRQEKMSISMSRNSIHEWYPGSAYGSVLYTLTYSGFTVNSSKFGYYSIEFNNSSGSGFLTIQSKNNQVPSYLESRRFQASNLSYSFGIRLSMNSPVPKGIYVSIIGFNKNGKLLWITPIYPNTSLNQTLSLRFNPESYNVNTSFFTISLSLPLSENNTSSIVHFYNPSLYVSPPLPPDQSMLPVIMTELNGSNFYSTFPLLEEIGSASLVNSDIQSIESEIFINSFNGAPVGNDGNYSYVYILPDYSGNITPFSNITKTPGGLGGYSYSFSSNFSLNLSDINGYTYSNSAGMYAEGHGKVKLYLMGPDGPRILPISVNSSDFEWKIENFTPENYRLIGISGNGNVTINSLIVSYDNLTRAPLQNKLLNSTVVVSKSFSDFEFEMVRNVAYVFLSETYDSEWKFQSKGIESTHQSGLLFGNLFVINNHSSENESKSFIYFSEQPIRNDLIIVQIIAWGSILLLTLLIWLRSRGLLTRMHLFQ